MIQHHVPFRRALRAVFLVTGIAAAAVAARAQTVSTFATGTSASGGISRDSAGNLYVGQGGVNVYKVTPSAAVSTFTTLSTGQAYYSAVDSAGNVYISTYTAGTIVKRTPGGVQTTFANVPQALGMVFDEAGNLYVASLSNAIYKVTPAGVATVLASNIFSNGNGAVGLARDSAGNLYTAPNSGAGTAIMKISPTGVVSTFVTGTFNTTYGLAFDANGDLFVSSVGAGTVRKITPAGVISDFASGLVSPWGIVVDPLGNLFVSGSNRVYKITRSGVGVNFSAGSWTVPSATNVGVVSAPNWNNVAGGSGTNVALLDHSGSATAMRLTFSAAGSYNAFSGTSTGTANDTLYRGGLYGSNTSGEISFTVTDVPFSYYHVYVYSSVYPAQNTVSLSNGTTTYYYRSNGSTDSSATSLLETTSTDPANPTVGQGQYQVFRNLTGSSFTIATAGSIGGVISNNVFGFQIVPTNAPAPAITSAGVASGTFNTPFSYQITADYSPTSFGASGLPSGLSINTSTGLISGSPATTIGSPFNVTLSATNAGGTGTKPLTLTVAKAPAIVTLTNLSQTYDGAVKSASATTNPAGQPVNFSYTGAALPPLNAGSYGVFGVIAGTSNYTGSANGTLVVNKATAGITFANTTQVYTGSPRTIGVTTTPAGLATSVTYDGNATAPTNAGSYLALAAVNDSNYQGSASTTFAISKATASVALTNLIQAYDGAPKQVSVITTPANLPVAVTYNGSANAPSAGGDYAVIATVNDANYTGSASGTLKIQYPIQTLTILGGVGSQGEIAANTEYSRDNGATWHPAYLSGNHPWGNISGTTSWINQDPSPFVGLNETVLYRIRFDAPTEMTDPKMTFTINADNLADLSVNGTPIDSTAGGFSPDTKQVNGAAIVPGQNTITIKLTDVGGWVGINFRIDLEMRAPAPPVIIAPPPAITSALSANGTYNSPVSYTITAANSPTSFNATNLPAGLTVNTATGTISGAPGASGTFNVGISATNAAGTDSETLVLTIAKASATVALSNLTQTYDGTPKSAGVSTTPGSLPVTVTYNGSGTAPTAAGNYAVVATVSSPNHTGSANGTLVINKAAATVTLGDLNQPYDGTPKPVSVTTAPAGLTTHVLYNGAATVPSGIGSYNVVATVSNPNYAGSGSGTLKITDTIKPALTLPSDMVVEAPTAAGLPVHFVVTATDNVDGNLPVTLTPASGSTFLPGLATVTATATDASGNIATGSFTVKVRYVTLTADKSVVEVDEGATATNSGVFGDASGDAVTLSVSTGTLTQTSAGQWTYQQTLDVGGHPIEASLDADENLYVVNEVDLAKYDAAGNLVKRWAVPGTPKGIAVDAANELVYTISHGHTVQKYDLDGNHLASFGTDNLPIGQLNNAHCIAVDANGDLYVTDFGGSRVVVFNANGAYLRTWGGWGSGDGQFNFIQGIRIAPNGHVYVADRENHRVQYFKTDGTFLGKWGTQGSGDGQFLSPASIGIDPSGNVYVGDLFNHRVQKFTATGEFLDKFGPGTGAGEIVQPHGTVFPPAGRSVYIASWGNGKVVKYLTPGTWSWTYNAPLGSVGTSTVDVTATSAGGSTKVTSFTLVVKDITKPVVTVPADFAVEATSAAGAIVNFTATATDAVTASPIIAYSRAPGSVFPLGPTTVTVTATDAAGNVGTGSFTVTVVDTTKPVITAQPNLVVEATSAAGAVATFAPTASDLVDGNVTVTADPASGSTFAIGSTPVSLTATDAAGNTETSSFTVKVQDTTAPVITAPASQTLEATGPNGASATYAATATDAVGATVTYSHAPGSTFGLGSTTVTATATDAAGNASSDTFTITVRDTTKPLLTLPDNQIVEATSAAGAVATFSAAASDIVSGNVPVTLSAASGGTFAIGTTTVTATAKDAAGNTASGTFTITVRDTTKPVLTLPANQTLEATSAAGAIATFTASATDAVGATITYSHSSGGTFALGTTVVTVVAADAAGNSSSGTFTITVRDTTAPTFSALTASSNTLWPANHKMIAVTLTAATSDIVSGVTTKIVSVTSSEPDNGLGDGDTPNDIQVTGAMTLNLRAERGGKGDGRVYTITVEATDAAGNTTRRAVTVSVPKSQGGK